MKKRVKDRNKIENWRVTVESVGTPGQQERALRQAAKYVLSCLAGRKNNPPPGKINY